MQSHIKRSLVHQLREEPNFLRSLPADFALFEGPGHLGNKGTQWDSDTHDFSTHLREQGVLVRICKPKGVFGLSSGPDVFIRSAEHMH